MSGARQRAERYGRMAELACVWLLRLRGYSILGRRVKTRLGEIDIVARRGRTLAIVEVKARADQDGAAEALSPGQRLRIERAARALLSQRPALAALDCRFDLMLVAPGRLPVHVTDAWRPN